MKTESHQHPVLNVPNTLSFFRILTVPFMAWFFLHNQIWLAFVMVALSGLSDALDGYFARRLNQVTELGKMLDPVADKLTQVVATICIAVKFPSLIGILMVFVCKELLMTLGALLLLRRHRKPCASRWYGKLATLLFYASVAVIVVMDGFFVVEPGMFYLVSTILLSVTAVAMLYAMVRYFLVFLSLWKSEDPADSIDLRTVIGRKEGPDSTN